MIKLQVEGRVKEILIDNRDSFRIIVSDDINEVSCTIKDNYNNVSGIVTIGAELELKGAIVGQAREKEGILFNNIFQVESLKKIEKGENN